MVADDRRVRVGSRLNRVVEEMFFLGSGRREERV
jgi:hypothetical protein